MISNPYKDLQKSKSVEIKRNYFFYPNKSDISNNSEYHRRVCYIEINIEIFMIMYKIIIIINYINSMDASIKIKIMI